MLKIHKGGYLVKLVDNRCRPYLNGRISYAERPPRPSSENRIVDP
jgi:hypothetical protein